NVGHKVNHIMFAFAILNNLKNIYKPKSHHLLLLYPGTEHYDSLQVALDFLTKYLEDIKTGFYDNNTANSNNFCLWCDYKKELNRDFNYDWMINKNINKINQNFIKIDGHIKKLLFSMIALDHWVIDELHLLLRIMDQLSSLNFGKKKDQKIGQYTSLTGNDKLKILYEFNLSQIFREKHAIIICQLWNNFAKLYKSLKDPQVTELYCPNDITPYIHTIVYHVGEFMELHQEFGIANRGIRKSAIQEIVDYKNRMLYFCNQEVPSYFEKETKLVVNI
ncbi:2659_t:CDS:2, partial [Gigaspora margarita]